MAAIAIRSRSRRCRRAAAAALLAAVALVALAALLLTDPPAALDAPRPPRALATAAPDVDAPAAVDADVHAWAGRLVAPLATAPDPARGEETALFWHVPKASSPPRRWTT